MLINNVGVVMVTSGLLTREALERALARKSRSGGSLALNLVLEGAVEEGCLADFYAERYHLDRVDEATLQAVDRTTFGLIPLEIVYDSGILPLYLEGEQNLVAGMVDVSDRGLLSEAAFFSGYDIRPRILTVSQMARHFERLAWQPWKVGADEAEALARASRRDTLEGVDDLFEQTSVLDSQIQKALEASLDEIYPPAPPAPLTPMDSDPAGLDYVESEASVVETGKQPAIWMAGRAAREISQIRIVPPALSDTREPVVVDESEIGSAEVETVAMEALPDPTLSTDTAFRRVPITARKIAALKRPGESDTPLGEPPVVLIGEADTDTGPVQVLGINLDIDVTEPGGRPVVDEPVPVVSERDTEFGHRPKTARPAVAPKARPDPDAKKYFRLLTQLRATFGEGDPDVVAALKHISHRLLLARDRDELGDAIVEGLTGLYDGISVMTLNGPRAVVWRSVLQGQVASNMVGKTIDVEKGGVLHRISEERAFYFGPLPRASRLRATLGINHANHVLVAPVELRSKTILILCFDPGPQPFRSPGQRIEQLLVDLSRGLERVILLRKRSRRRP